MPKVSLTIYGQGTIGGEVTRLVRARLATLYQVRTAEVGVIFGHIQPARLGRPCDVTFVISITEDVPRPRPESPLLLEQLATITDPSSGEKLGLQSIGLYSNNAQPVYHLPAFVGAA